MDRPIARRALRDGLLQVRGALHVSGDARKAKGWTRLCRNATAGLHECSNPKLDGVRETRSSLHLLVRRYSAPRLWTFPFPWETTNSRVHLRSPVSCTSSALLAVRDFPATSSS